MKTLILSALRCALNIKTKILILSLVLTCSARATFIETTYVYTGNPFTFVTGSYSTSDFVTAMITLASPLAANTPLTAVTPIAFSLSDGVQTFNGPNPLIGFIFRFATGPSPSGQDTAEEFRGATSQLFYRRSYGLDEEQLRHLIRFAPYSGIFSGLSSRLEERGIKAFTYRMNQNQAFGMTAPFLGNSSGNAGFRSVPFLAAAFHLGASL